MKYKLKKVLKRLAKFPNHNFAKITSLGNIKMGHPTSQLLFSWFDEANKKVRNFNENINFSLYLSLFHDIMRT